MKPAGENQEKLAVDVYRRENELLEQVWKRVAPELPENKESSLTKPTPDQAHTLPLAQQLTQFTVQLYESAQKYQMMARRYRQFTSVFSKYSMQERQNAKRLSAHLFLETGVRLPQPRMPHRTMPQEACAALRSQILAEQKQAHGFRDAAKTTRDPELQQLYLDMAKTAEDHVAALRHLLVQTV